MPNTQESEVFTSDIESNSVCESYVSDMRNLSTGQNLATTPPPMLLPSQATPLGSMPPPSRATSIALSSPTLPPSSIQPYTRKRGKTVSSEKREQKLHDQRMKERRENIARLQREKEILEAENIEKELREEIARLKDFN
jgi:hypothetical protein